MSLIEAIDVYQRFGTKDVLKGISLAVEKGGVLAIIGPTGAGKTTLLRLLDHLEKPSSGRIIFDGREVSRSHRAQTEVRRRLSMVFQKPVAFNASVYDNVAYPLKVRGYDTKTTAERVNMMLQTVGLDGHRKRNARTLSGGETQKVALARALVTDPEVLLLDEPTANLDPVSTSKIEEVLAHIIRQQKTTIVISTHDMVQGQRLAGRIGVLMNGEILQIGSPNEIFTSPQSREVAEFVGVENILAGTVAGKDNRLVTLNLDNKGGVIQAISDQDVGETVYVLIRPEDITLSLSKDLSSARNVLQGEIARIIPLGPLLRVEMDCGFPLLSLVTKTSGEELELAPGKEVYASFKATAVRTVKRWA